MITSDLIDYIKSQLEQNISKDLITKDLIEVGWRPEDIEEGFLDIKTEIKDTETVPVKVDPYREIPEIVAEPIQKEGEYNTPIINTIEKIEPMKVWTPIVIKPKEEKIEEVKKVEEKPKEKGIEFSKSTTIEPYMIEVGVEKKPDTIGPVFEQTKDEILKDEIKLEEKNASINGNLQTVDKINNIGSISPSVSSPVQNPPMSKIVINQSVMSDIVPKNAMISSYSQDIIAAQKEGVEPSKHKNIFLKLGILIVLLIFIGGMIFAFVEGYIKIPWSNMSFSIVKKDPRVIILSAPATILSLKSYKMETTVNVSSPSFSNITTGLASGETTTSKDRDSVGINILGMANHVNSKLFFDYILNFKSSLLKNDIKSNLKYDGSQLYIDVPNLVQVLNSNAPTPATVALAPNKLGLIIPELSTSFQDIIKKFDAYNISSGEIPPYLKSETALIFKEFIDKLSYTEKGVESIHGVDTYHYDLVADRQSTKKLLSSLADLFIVKLTTDQKNNLDQILGSSTFSSFEVWIGKNDNNLYQIKFTLNAPLSSVLGLNDSGIAGNEVNLDWKTTYYDLDVANNIEMPKTSIDMDSFIKNIKDIKIKNILSSFKPQATAFRNAVGSYGQKSNPSGTCTNPNPGSMFSPTGHSKGAGTAVSVISTTMKSLLSETNGNGLCYSTAKDWALEVPLFTFTETAIPSFYCTDSIGNLITLQAPITGTVCK